MQVDAGILKQGKLHLIQPVAQDVADPVILGEHRGDDAQLAALRRLGYR